MQHRPDPDRTVLLIPIRPKADVQLFARRADASFAVFLRFLFSHRSQTRSLTHMTMLATSCVRHLETAALFGLLWRRAPDSEPQSTCPPVLRNLTAKPRPLLDAAVLHVGGSEASQEPSVHI